MVLSWWDNHCDCSPISFIEQHQVTADPRPRANWLGRWVCLYTAKVCIHHHLKADTYFTIPHIFVLYFEFCLFCLHLHHCFLSRRRCHSVGPRTGTDFSGSWCAMHIDRTVIVLDCKHKESFIAFWVFTDYQSFECDCLTLFLHVLWTWCLIFSQVDYRAKIWSCNFCFQRNQVVYVVVLCIALCLQVLTLLVDSLEDRLACQKA